MLLIELVSWLIFGAVPALRRGVDLSKALGDGGRSATGGRGRQRIRNGLVVFQLALALMLIVVSGLMIRSFLELRAADPGCDPVGVLTMRVPISFVEYPEPADSLEFYLEVLEKGLRIMDTTAISLCMDNGLPIVVFNIRKKGTIRRIAQGADIGSTVS